MLKAYSGNESKCASSVCLCRCEVLFRLCSLANCKRIQNFQGSGREIKDGQCVSPGWELVDDFQSKGCTA